MSTHERQEPMKLKLHEFMIGIGTFIVIVIVIVIAGAPIRKLLHLSKYAVMSDKLIAYS